MTATAATVVNQVEREDYHEARCSKLGCDWWDHHDRLAGDNDSPSFAASAHCAETGHTVDVIRVLRTVTEYAQVDDFLEVTG